MSIRISQLKDHSISVNQARYATSIVAKYLDTATVKVLRYAHWFRSIIISQLKDHSISVNQARYFTSIVAKYLDTDTVKVSTKFYKTTLTADMILTKEDVSTSDEQVDNLNREYNIHYRA